jgi:predicted adenine nucleotide alpha hydrolase (AANH) superfamily ATPase
MSERPCASSQDIDAFFANNSQKIYFTIYFINPRINPDQAEYLTYYMED